MHVAQNTAKTMKQKCQKVEVWHGSTICQKSEFKGREHILFRSLLAIIDVWWPLVTWLWINSAPRVSERQARPAMLCPRRDWLRSDMLHDSFQRQQPAGPASLPNLHTHSLECQPSVLYWELGLAVLVTGLRWTADGAFCPAAPWGQVERVRETGVFMFHLLPPPPPSPQRPGRMPMTLILEAERQRIRQRKQKGDMRWRKRKENGMWWYENWSHKICSIQINRGFL